MDILPRIDEIVIPIEKFINYVLHPENSKGKHMAFERALGYNLKNADKLVENIEQNIHKFPCVEKADKGHGARYSVDMLLTGANGKSARVITAWIDDNATGEMRLTSAYVKDRRLDYDKRISKG
jgi:filamentous hemagglutinin